LKRNIFFLASPFTVDFIKNLEDRFEVLVTRRLDALCQELIAGEDALSPANLVRVRNAVKRRVSGEF
jgi:hypothetical protein